MKLGTALRSTLHASLFAVMVIAWAVLSIGTTLSAAEPRGSDAPAERAARGKVLFRVYCASCHGPTADGDGAVSHYLKAPPPDIKNLRRENQGKFPAERVYRLIDGRDEMAVHGTREMPVWGLTFQDLDRDHDQEEDVAERIKDLVAFVESIQKD